MDKMAVRFELGDETLADEIIDDLEVAGAEIIGRPKRGLVPILPIVVGAVVSLAALVTIVQKVLAGRKCRTIIDARTSEIKTQVDCSVKDGRLVVFTRDGEKVSVIDAPSAIDFTAIVGAATKGSLEEIKQLAGKSGAKIELG